VLIDAKPPAPVERRHQRPVEEDELRHPGLFMTRYAGRTPDVYDEGM